MKNIYLEIKKKWPQLVELDCSLKEKSYLKTGGKAAVLITIKQMDHVTDIFRFLVEHKIKFEVLGRGTNLIIKEGIIDKVILILAFRNEALGIIKNEIEFPASLPMIKANKLAHDNLLSGLEFFVGIPGTVGGAVVMNAGIKNKEVKDVLSEITLFSSSRIKKIKAKQLHLSYRTSNIKKDEVILSAKFQLQICNEKEIANLKKQSLVDLNLRNKTQPYQDRTVGSTFSNPLPDYAGELIERCGLKGERIGGISVSSQHANFIVNDGTGTSDQARELITLIIDKVKKKTGKKLKEEVRFLGYE